MECRYELGQRSAITGTINEEPFEYKYKSDGITNDDQSENDDDKMNYGDFDVDGKSYTFSRRARSYHSEKTSQHKKPQRQSHRYRQQLGKTQASRYKTNSESGRLRDNQNSYTDRSFSSGVRTYESMKQVYGDADSSELDSDIERLYSVKWYKDNEEFYRFVPKVNPQKQSYRVDGIRVIVSKRSALMKI